MTDDARRDADTPDDRDPQHAPDHEDAPDEDVRRTAEGADAPDHTADPEDGQDPADAEDALEGGDQDAGQAGDHDDTEAPTSDGGDSPDGDGKEPLIVDPDADIETVNDDPYAASRESVGDPDEWRLAARNEDYLSTAARMGDRMEHPPEDDPATVRKKRMVFHTAAGSAVFFTVLGLALHILQIGPVGLDTWTITLATVGVFLATFVFPDCDFRPKRPDEYPEGVDLDQVRHRHELTLNGFSVAFALLIVALFLFEFIALLVALGWVEDLSGTSITFAKHFMFVPAFVIAVLVGGLYARTRIASREPQHEHEAKILAVAMGLFAVANLVGAFFAIGFARVVTTSQIEAHQGIYIQSVAVIATIVMVNLRLAYPNVFQIIEKEVQRSKEVDRKGAEQLRKRMMRNYMLALFFVVGSIGFLVGNAAGVVKTEGSNQLDIVIVVYLLFGILFLGILVMNYLQAQQIRGKARHRPQAGQLIGKRRYSPEEVNKYLVLGISGGLGGLFLFLTALVGSGLVDSFGPFDVDPSWGTDLFVMAVLGGVGPYGFYFARESARIRAIDEKFPDFLRDLAESQRAGMTLPRALVTAASGEYGPLTKEIKIMAAQVEWGVNFNEALERFARRTRTPLIQRTVSLVCEAAASGGNVVDVLAAASDDAREIKNIMAERKAQMSVYSLIIYIAFFVFLTVIAVLNSQFIPELAKSTSKVAGTSLGGIQFGEIDVPTYQRLFFHAAIIQGLGGGLVSGVMTEGHPWSGLRHSFIMTLIAYSLFRFVIF